MAILPTDFPQATKIKTKKIKVTSCIPPAYYLEHAKRLSLQGSVTYDSGKLKSTAFLDLFMTPKGTCPSAYTPILIIRVFNERKNIWGNWKEHSRRVDISHGYTKNYPEVFIHNNQTYPSFSSEWGLTLNEGMSTVGNAINVYYAQAFSEINTNDYGDIFRLQNYWAHIAVYGGPHGATIDFGPFM